MKSLPLPADADAETMSAWLLRPVDETMPCGPSLEYEPAHVLLMARLTPRSDAQYGVFIDTPGAPDWAGIARDCESLLRRTRDIPVLVGCCRARLALANAAGLERALALLHAVLRRWPDDVHPQRRIDGADEPMVRANAIAALADRDGLLGEIGDLTLLRKTAPRLTVRDVARSLSAPRAADAADAVAAGRYLHEMRTGADIAAAAHCQALQRAAMHARAIDMWSREQLGEDAPSLERLHRLLEPYATATATATATAPATARKADTPGASSAGAASTFPLPKLSVPPIPHFSPDAAHPMHSPSPATSAPRARHDAAACIRAAREWFEMHEPSSPVAVLLKQAERMVGQRFVQVADAIPLELLRQWDARADAKTA